MDKTQWQICLLDGDDLMGCTVDEFSSIYQRSFSSSHEVNHILPVMTSSFRQDGIWRVFLLLCPWMLGRVFMPDRPPELEVPAGWMAKDRVGQEYVALGPSISFQARGGKQKGNIQYQPELGHFLIQPLIFSMDTYGSATDVFNAWSSVIQYRDKKMRESGKECLWQTEVSRRELFFGLFRNGSG